MLTHTKTFTVLEVNQATFKDIRERLIAAVGEAYASDYLGKYDDGDLIHLDGVALRAEEAEQNEAERKWKPQVEKPLVGVKHGPPDSGWRCQFCGTVSSQVDWAENNVCPRCGKAYDYQLAQDSEE